MTNWLRNDYLAITLIILLALAVVFVPSVLRAEPATPAVECVEWATAGPWTITRCEDWEAAETCLIANSGMIVCNFE